MMHGAKPMWILLKEDAVPIAIHRPTTIPAHWQEQVHADIERDIKLGVLERAPQNTPVTWCSRMHVGYQGHSSYAEVGAVSSEK